MSGLRCNFEKSKIKNIMVIVLKTRGKRDSIDKVSVHLFDDEDTAKRFIATESRNGKYYSCLQIISPGEEIEGLDMVPVENGGNFEG